MCYAMHEAEVWRENKEKRGTFLLKEPAATGRKQKKYHQCRKESSSFIFIDRKEKVLEAEVPATSGQCLFVP